MKIMLRNLLSSLGIFLCLVLASNATAETVKRGEIVGGVAHVAPGWFKESFLEIQDDVAAGRPLQDGIAAGSGIIDEVAGTLANLVSALDVPGIRIALRYKVFAAVVEPGRAHGRVLRRGLHSCTDTRGQLGLPRSFRFLLRRTGTRAEQAARDQDRKT